MTAFHRSSVARKMIVPVMGVVLIFFVRGHVQIFLEPGSHPSASLWNMARHSIFQSKSTGAGGWLVEASSIDQIKPSGLTRTYETSRSDTSDLMGQDFRLATALEAIAFRRSMLQRQ